MSPLPILSPGIHAMSEQSFISTYCHTDDRKKFIEPIQYIFKYSRDSSVKSIFVGGSFLTEKKEPKDIDFLIVYERDNQIPPKDEMVALENVELDVMFCSYEEKTILASFIHLFSHDRNGNERGVVQINLDVAISTFVAPDKYDKRILDIIKNTYVGRSMIRRNSHKGILISIHGLLSRAEWNFEIAPIASSNGWIFAPYVYDAPRALLFTSGKRKMVLENFRSWIYDVSMRYKDQSSNVSVVAHSYGTFLVGKYLLGFDTLPVNSLRIQ